MSRVTRVCRGLFLDSALVYSGLCVLWLCALWICVFFGSLYVLWLCIPWLWTLWLFSASTLSASTSSAPQLYLYTSPHLIRQPTSRCIFARDYLGQSGSWRSWSDLLCKVVSVRSRRDESLPLSLSPTRQRGRISIQRLLTAEESQRNRGGIAQRFADCKRSWISALP